MAGNISNSDFLGKKTPKSWRITKMVAIPKPGKYPKMASSDRPISLLSMCYKLLERIILHRISPAADEILNIEQAGFRPGRSTQDEVLALTTYVESGYQRRDKTGDVFLDLTAAYNTVYVCMYIFIHQTWIYKSIQ